MNGRSGGGVAIRGARSGERQESELGGKPGGFPQPAITLQLGHYLVRRLWRDEGSKAVSYLRDISVRHKLLLMMMGLSTVLILLATVVFIVLDVLAYHKQTKYDLRVLADAVANQITAAVVLGGQDVVSNNLAAFTASDLVTHANLRLPDGSVFGKYTARGFEDGSVQGYAQAQGA